MDPRRHSHPLKKPAEMVSPFPEKYLIPGTGKHFFYFNQEGDRIFPKNSVGKTYLFRGNPVNPPKIMMEIEEESKSSTNSVENVKENANDFASSDFEQPSASISTISPESPDYQKLQPKKFFEGPQNWHNNYGSPKENKIESPDYVSKDQQWLKLKPRKLYFPGSPPKVLSVHGIYSSPENKIRFQYCDDESNNNYDGSGPSPGENDLEEMKTETGSLITNADSTSELDRLGSEEELEYLKTSELIAETSEEDVMDFSEFDDLEDENSDNDNATEEFPIVNCICNHGCCTIADLIAHA